MENRNVEMPWINIVIGTVQRSKAMKKVQWLLPYLFKII